MIEKIGNLEEIVVGDRVLLVERMFSGETRKISANVIEIRLILGDRIYVIETEHGKRKLVCASQISKTE